MNTNLSTKDILCRVVAAHKTHPKVHHGNSDSARMEGMDLLSAVHKVWLARNRCGDWRPSDDELLGWKRGRGAVSCRDMSDRRTARCWLSWARTVLVLFGMV